MEEHNCSACPMHGMCSGLEDRKNIIHVSNGIMALQKNEKLKSICNGKSILVITNANKSEKEQKKLAEALKIAKASKITFENVIEDNMKILFDYEIIYVMDGDITNLLELVKNTYIKFFLLEFLECNEYIGDGVGSLILDEDVEWYFNALDMEKSDINSFKGLNLSRHHIIHHYDKIKKDCKEKLSASEIKIEPLNDGEMIVE